MNTPTAPAVSGFVDFGDVLTSIDVCLEILCGTGQVAPWTSRLDYLAEKRRRSLNWYHPRVVAFMQKRDAQLEREQARINPYLDEPRDPRTAREYFTCWIDKDGQAHYQSISICPYWDRDWCYSFLRDEILPQWQNSWEHLTGVLQWLGVEIDSLHISTEDLYNFLLSVLWESPRLVELAWMYWPLSSFVVDHPCNRIPRSRLGDETLLMLEEKLFEAVEANEAQARRWVIQTGNADGMIMLDRMEQKRNQKALPGVA